MNYATFLKEIINNDFEALLYFEKAYKIFNINVIKKNVSNSENSQFGENSNSSIVIISATPTKIGYIVHINNEL